MQDSHLSRERIPHSKGEKNQIHHPRDLLLVITYLILRVHVRIVSTEDIQEQREAMPAGDV